MKLRWVIATVSAFALGATLAAGLAGAALGGLGGLVADGALSSRARLVLLGAALAVAVGLELLPGRMPGAARSTGHAWRACANSAASVSRTMSRSRKPVART